MRRWLGIAAAGTLYSLGDVFDAIAWRVWRWAGAVALWGKV